MPAPLFEFELRPLREIQPWGGPEAPSLHWFGLTDGLYWIQAGEHTLFEYAVRVQEILGVSRFCDYQVARLYEDVLDVVPYALEPVPKELRRYISVDEATERDHYWKEWCASEKSTDLIDDAGPWMGRRTLDCTHLSPSTHIVFWSDDDTVHIEWDNRGKLLEGNPAWSEQLGRWNLPREHFMNEVRSFHDRLMEQMSSRVEEVAAGALAERAYVDLPGLRREHHVRSQAILRNLGAPAPPTDWEPIIAAIRALEASDA